MFFYFHCRTLIDLSSRMHQTNLIIISSWFHHLTPVIGFDSWHWQLDSNLDFDNIQMEIWTETEVICERLRLATGLQRDGGRLPALTRFTQYRHINFSLKTHYRHKYSRRDNQLFSPKSILGVIWCVALVTHYKSLETFDTKHCL